MAKRTHRFVVAYKSSKQDGNRKKEKNVERSLLVILESVHDDAEETEKVWKELKRKLGEERKIEDEDDGLDEDE